MALPIWDSPAFAMLSIGSARPHQQQAPQLVLELDELRALELPRPARDGLHRQRVHRPSVLHYLEMEVRSGRKPARADVADHVAATDGLAGIGGDAAHVAVFRFDPAGMVDLDSPAIPSGPARTHHFAVRRR